MQSTSVFVFLSLATGAFAVIANDLNCTASGKYTAGAVNCDDVTSTAACQKVFPTVSSAPFPVADGADARPLLCYTTSATFEIDQSLKDMAIANCPKTCGYCCQTAAYDCKNVDFPRLKCDTITKSQCSSVTWRTIIAQDCPNACGFCGQGGCVDAVTNCANDLSICNNIGTQDFVNQYCQKTCARCPSTTSSSITTTGSNGGGGSCTSYIADSSSACASWAANGFCNNTFYTVAQRRSRCATTCRLC